MKRMKVFALAAMLVLLVGVWWGISSQRGIAAKEQINESANRRISEVVDRTAKVEERVLEQIETQGRADLVVHFREQADLEQAYGMGWEERGRFVYAALQQTAERSQANARLLLERRGLAYRSFISGNTMYVWSGDLETVEALAGLEEVARVSLPRTLSILDAELPAVVKMPASPLEALAERFLYTTSQPEAPQTLEWGVVDAKADQFWSAFSLQGEGIVVANIDTGVEWTHPALDQAYKCADNPGNEACWYDPGDICGGEPCDDNGHGTATMGVIVADDDPDLPHQAGIAPGAKWIACKGCESAGCSEYALMACMEWILAPGGNPTNRPNIVSNSWGWLDCDDEFKDEIQAWSAAGILATFSPGGEGPGCGTIGSPAEFQEVFAPTAHDDSRTVAPFASRGPGCEGDDPFTKPNISAPGVNIWVAVPPDGWQVWSGTSLSNPAGAGGLALILSCNSSLIGDAFGAFSALQDAADTPPAGNCGAPPDGEGNYTYGYGYLNILAAGVNVCGGVLRGHVYEAGSGEPIEGAVVTASLSGPSLEIVEAMTDPEGFYTMGLISGTYELTATKSGYYPSTVPSVTITTSEVITQDFFLIAPQVAMTKTVGLDTETCSAVDNMLVLTDTEVTYCYTLVNTGLVTLTVHDLVDSQLGVIYDDHNEMIPPGGSTWVTATALVTESVVNAATWTAYDENGFSASASDVATVTVDYPEIELTKTVGTGAGVCAATDSLTVPWGTEVTYCYNVFNSGPLTLTLHDLVDSQLGNILAGEAMTLAPNESLEVMTTTLLTASVVNTATWRAYNEEGPSVWARDQATVTVEIEVPEILLVKTVGVDPGVCATTDHLEVPEGTPVTYCYILVNIGSVNVTRHDLTDDQLGVILSDYSYDLGPGDNFYITRTVVVTESVVNTAIWTGHSGAGLVDTGEDSATVTVIMTPEWHDIYLPLVYKWW